LALSIKEYGNRVYAILKHEEEEVSNQDCNVRG